MITGIGVDIVEIDRVKEAVEKTEKFLEKIFTEKEIEHFKTRKMNYETIAGNFAGKEAVVKALGTGFVGIEPKDIEILRDHKGKPTIKVLKKEIHRELEFMHIFISISHSKNYAVANVVIEMIR